MLFSRNMCHFYCGPGSSVGIATDYGLDGPGSNPGGTRFYLGDARIEWLDTNYPDRGFLLPSLVFPG